MEVIPMGKKATKKGKAKASKKTSAKKKVPATEKVVENVYGKGGKTGIIVRMVEQGKNRKQILDKLVSLNPDVTRKTNSGLVSTTLGKMNKRNIDSGVARGKKKIVVVKGAKKKGAKKAS